MTKATLKLYRELFTAISMGINVGEVENAMIAHIIHLERCERFVKKLAARNCVASAVGGCKGLDLLMADRCNNCQAAEVLRKGKRQN